MKRYKLSRRGIFYTIQERRSFLWFKWYETLSFWYGEPILFNSICEASTYLGNLRFQEYKSRVAYTFEDVTLMEDFK